MGGRARRTRGWMPKECYGHRGGRCLAMAAGRLHLPRPAALGQVMLLHDGARLLRYFTTVLELLNEAMEKEQKTVKYWSACAEKLGVESLEKFNGDPMPHLLIYLGGTLKQTIDGANAPKLVKLVNEHLESFVAE